MTEFTTNALQVVEKETTEVFSLQKTTETTEVFSLQKTTEEFSLQKTTEVFSLQKTRRGWYRNGADVMYVKP